jgi:hypothetical protein
MKSIIEIINLDLLPIVEANFLLYFMRNYKSIFKTTKQVFILNRNSFAKLIYNFWKIGKLTHVLVKQGSYIRIL